MKLFIWEDPYHVNYGTSLVVAVAETLEEATEKAMKAPGAKNHVTLGWPTHELDLPVAASWHQWSE